MQTQEFQKRQSRSEHLKVLKSEDGHYFVESSTGKILYQINEHNNKFTCTCSDYQQNVKLDAEFQCKHIFSVMNSQDYAPAHFIEKHQPQLDDRFFINIKGKEFVLYSGVLDLANQKGLMKLEVDLIQFPTKENRMEAICKATAVSKSGETFTDFGDANPDNCTALVSKHIIRVASTRAKGRALRDMCNIGMACLEELADHDDLASDNSMHRSSKESDEKSPEQKKKSPAKTTRKKTSVKSKSNQPKISEAQKKAIANLSKRKGIEGEDLSNQLNELFGTDLENLSSEDAGQFIQQLQKAK